MFPNIVSRFNDRVMPTLGVDFSAKNLPAVDNSTIRLHLWDVAGERTEYRDPLP